MTNNIYAAKPGDPFQVALAGADGTSAVSTSNPVPFRSAGPGPYTLLSNATATGASVPSVVGASYIWSVTTTGWNGATATLQALGPDGVTWIDVLAKTANYTGGVALGNNATVRVAISVAVPSAGVYSSLT